MMVTQVTMTTEFLATVLLLLNFPKGFLCCPSEYLNYRNACVTIPNLLGTYVNGEVKCAEENAILAPVLNKEDLNELNVIFPRLIRTNGLNASYQVYIGVRWDSNNIMSLSDKSPNSQFNLGRLISYSPKTCASLKLTNTSAWKSDSCTNSAYALCMKFDYNPCPEKYFLYNMDCFSVSSVKKDYYDAKQYCRKGGNLAVVRTKETHDFLTSYLKANGISMRVLIEGKADYVPYKPIFLDDDGVPLKFFLWDTAAGEPTNLYGGDNCIAINGEHNFLWYDNKCTVDYNFLCQYRLLCPDGFFNVNGSCYFVSNETKYYDVANRTCRNENSALSIISPDKIAILDELAYRSYNAVFVENVYSKGNTTEVILDKHQNLMLYMKNLTWKVKVSEYNETSKALCEWNGCQISTLLQFHPYFNWLPNDYNSPSQSIILKCSPPMESMDSNKDYMVYTCDGDGLWYNFDLIQCYNPGEFINSLIYVFHFIIVLCCVVE